MSGDAQDPRRATAYALFDKLMDLPAVEQRKILREECDDPEVREWVVDLIAADSTDGGLLDSDLMPAVGLDELPDSKPAVTPPQEPMADPTAKPPAVQSPAPARTPAPAQTIVQSAAPAPSATAPGTKNPAPESFPAVAPKQVRPPRSSKVSILLAVGLVLAAAIAALAWIKVTQLQDQISEANAARQRAEADAAIAVHGQAVSLYRQRDYAEARLRFAQAIQLGEKAWGTEHENIGVFRSNHANNLLGLEQWEAAEMEFTTAIDILQRAYGGSSTQVADARMGYGELLLREKAWAAAAREFRQVLNVRSSSQQVAVWRRGVAGLRLGECLLRLGDRNAAQVLQAGLTDLASGPAARVAGEIERGQQLLAEAR